MRSAIIAAAAFAASAVAVPYVKQRDVVIDTTVDMVYVTTYVTVTGGAAEPTAQVQQHYGHPKKPKWWGKPQGHKTTTTTVEQSSPAPTYSQPADTWSSPATSPSSPASSPTSSPPRSAPASAPTDYSEKVILHHNVHRANHSAPDVAWDDNLAASAQQVADSCVYAHNV
jgi:hypothetical protein